MQVPPKATSSPRLDLLALAEVRMPELRAHAACKKCEGCDGSKCHEWKSRVPVLERRDWPACPIGMTRAPAWRGVVTRYVASKVSPIAGWPGSESAWALAGMLAIKSAAQDEETRQMEAAKAGHDASIGPPRRTSKGGA